MSGNERARAFCALVSWHVGAPKGMSRVQFSHLFADCFSRLLNHCSLCVLPGVLHVHCCSPHRSSPLHGLVACGAFSAPSALLMPPRVLERPSLCLECFLFAFLCPLCGLSSTVATVVDLYANFKKIMRPRKQCSEFFCQASAPLPIRLHAHEHSACQPLVFFDRSHLIIPATEPYEQARQLDHHIPQCALSSLAAALYACLDVLSTHLQLHNPAYPFDRIYPFLFLPCLC